MNTWGSKIKVSIFGESHGGGIGAVIDGIPSGLAIDTEFIKSEMQRRAPGQNNLSTPRKEADEVEILSGMFDGKTTGTPICGIIRNTNTRSKDYNKDLLRPGHADFTGFMRYGESHDFRGGGHFSGRITAGLVFAGAIAKQVLKEQGIRIGSHIKAIHNIAEKSFLDIDNLSAELLERLTEKAFPVMDEQIGNAMQEKILAASADKNSVGGIIECAVIGAKPGWGAPFFASTESLISSIMFSIPAVKGIEFGRGFEMSAMFGSEANDPFRTDGEKIFTTTNNNGGINGGITNGMPIVFSVAIKPTPSIARQQDTVDIEKMENTTIEISGRHDPCIVQRAAVVVECAAALAILDSELI
ncbi:MAG: chorismate synthase [Ruminococcaceae bacterium]|nr:chorismate synthase [Oscillospiraceae bacterium]